MPAYLASLITNNRPDVLATAYAPPAPDYASTSPFASLLRDEPDLQAGRFIPPVGERDHAWIAGAPAADRLHRCGTEVPCRRHLFRGARRDREGTRPRWPRSSSTGCAIPPNPDTVCGVVYQKPQLAQPMPVFFLPCDGTTPRVRSSRHYRVAEEVALAVTAGKIFLPEVGFVHALSCDPNVSPRWARSMERLQRIGLHIFYRTRGGRLELRRGRVGGHRAEFPHPIRWRLGADALSHPDKPLIFKLFLCCYGSRSVA